jgi:hypothetical protein
VGVTYGNELWGGGTAPYLDLARQIKSPTCREPSNLPNWCYTMLYTATDLLSTKSAQCRLTMEQIDTVLLGGA